MKGHGADGGVSGLLQGPPAFRERFPWLGGDLQTIRNIVRPPPSNLLDTWPAERLEIHAADGSGDRLLGTLHRPLETEGRPVVMLVHGLTGCEGSFYILHTARALLDAGYPVFRFNLRGAGPSRETCGGHYSAASSPDIASAVDVITSQYATEEVVLIGYSLGASVILKFLAEAGTGSRVRSAAAVSAPLDLAGTARRMMALRNSVYHRWLLDRMKAEAVAGASAATSAERMAIARARTVYEFDDSFIAPRNGFAGADDYYARCSAAGFLSRIPCPTLIVHGRNDPWIPPDAYDSIDWSRLPRLIPAIADGGGHVGFHGVGSPRAWHDRRVLAFLADGCG